MKNKIKVLIVPSWFPSKVNKYNGIFIKRHAEAISQYCDVSVLYVVYSSNLKRKQYKIEIIEKENLFIVVVYYGLTQLDGVNNMYVKILKKLYRSIIETKINYFLANIKGYRLISERRGAPDILHVHVILYAGIITNIIKRILKRQYIVTEHWSGYLKNSTKYNNLLDKIVSKYVVSNARLVTTITNNLKQAMIDKGLSSTYKVVNNVVNFNEFYPAEGNQKYRKIIRIVHVSLLGREKNINVVIDVIDRISHIRSDFKLTIVGAGNCMDELIKYAKEKHLYRKKIFFLGERSEIEISYILRKSSFMLMFSKYESMPCVISEAFASGIPVIASNVGGISEHVNDTNGLLVDKDDVEGLYDAIIFMLDKYSTYSSKNIYEYALSKFSYEKIGKEYHSIYNQILSC